MLCKYNFFIKYKIKYSRLSTLNKCVIDYKFPLLHYLIINNYKISLIRLLIERDINLDKRDYNGNSALHHAVLTSDYELIRLLLENGADVNKRNRKKNDPFNNVILFNYDYKIIKMLCNHGQVLNTNKYYERSKLYLVLNKLTPDFKLMKLLINHGINLHIIDNFNGSLFHLVLKKKIIDIKIINLFLEEMSNINLHDYFGETPLHIVINKNYPDEIIKLLLKKGADPNLNNLYDGYTPFYSLLRNNSNPEMTQLFIDYKSKYYVSNYYCKSALYIALNFSQNFEVVKVLLNNGIDLNCINIQIYKNMYYHDNFIKLKKNLKIYLFKININTQLINDLNNIICKYLFKNSLLLWITESIDI